MQLLPIGIFSGLFFSVLVAFAHFYYKRPGSQVFYIGLAFLCGFALSMGVILCGYVFFPNSESYFSTLSESPEFISISGISIILVISIFLMNLAKPNKRKE